jgi:hypothetical protein
MQDPSRPTLPRTRSVPCLPLPVLDRLQNRMRGSCIVSSLQKGRNNGHNSIVGLPTKPARGLDKVLPERHVQVLLLAELPAPPLHQLIRPDVHHAAVAELELLRHPGAEQQHQQSLPYPYPLGPMTCANSPPPGKSLARFSRVSTLRGNVRDRSSFGRKPRVYWPRTSPSPLKRVVLGIRASMGSSPSTHKLWLTL